MNIVKQSAKLVTGFRPLQMVEYCARVCYASTDKMTDKSARPFVENLIKRGHYTPLEHAYIRIYPGLVDDADMQVYVNSLYVFAAPGDYPLADRRLTRGAFYKGVDDHGTYVAGNLRDVYMYLSAHDASLDLYESDAVRLAPDYAVFEIVTDRGIATEFFRHRTMSYDDSGHEAGYISNSVEFVPELSVNQQSTRYVNFSKHPFSVVLPEPFAWAYDPCCAEYHTWSMTCSACFESYKLLTEHNIPPEQARNVLPLSTATTVLMSGSIVNWLYVLNLRMPQGAHPQARLLASYIWQELKEHYSEPLARYISKGILDGTYLMIDYDKEAEKIQELVKRNKGD